MQVDNHDQVASETAHPQFTHEMGFLLKRMHAQKTQGLPPARLPGCQNVQPGHLPKAGAQGMKRRTQRADVREIVKLLKFLLHSEKAKRFL